MTKIQRDLFGNAVKPEYDDLVMALELIDDEAFESRLKRFRYLDKLREPPDTCQYECSDIGNVTVEMSLLYEEARLAFVNGAFIAVTFLCQAFIEHWLTDYISQKRNLVKKSENNLYEMLNLCREEGLLHTYLVERIDDIRRKRNPLTHSKPHDHPYSVFQRAFERKIDVEDLLEQDARIAIEIMHTILET